MRLPDAAHTSRPWRIHELAPDFRLEDVWELPGPGGPGDFPRLIEGFARGDPHRTPARAVRALFAIRSRAGRAVRLGRRRARARLEGGDAPRALAGRAARLPRAGARSAPVHAALHDRGRVGGGDRQPDDARGDAHRLDRRAETARSEAQMAVLVKPNGLLGDVYMAAIRPFRHRSSTRRCSSGSGAMAAVARDRAAGGGAGSSSTLEPGRLRGRFLGRADRQVRADARAVGAGDPRGRARELPAAGPASVVRARAQARAGGARASSCSAGRSAATPPSTCCSVPSRDSGCRRSCSSSRQRRRPVLDDDRAQEPDHARRLGTNRSPAPQDRAAAARAGQL